MRAGMDSICCHMLQIRSFITVYNLKQQTAYAYRHFIPKHKHLGKPSKKKRLYKDIGFICFDTLPPPPNKDIKNKDILLIYLTPSLVPKIRTYEPFVFGFKKPDFAFFSHNFYGVGKFKKKLVKCS